DWRVRYRVVDTLTQIGEPSISGLLNVLSHKNRVVRKGAVEALGELGIEDPKIIKDLSIMLKDKKEDVRGKAADSLRSIGKKAIPSLIEALQTSKSKMSVVIISSIGGIGIDASEAIPQLISFLDNKPKIKIAIARALGKIGLNSSEAIDGLKQLLYDPKTNVRREAALSLGKIGIKAESAVDDLLYLLNDKKPDVRWRATEALGKIGLNNPKILSGLQTMIKDECDYVCESADNAIDELTEGN
ncbi:MAG: HEAT repeat domain-containing protein, partial [Promethearchaeota archaeon]